jgi:hypothetical protein
MRIDGSPDSYVFYVRTQGGLDVRIDRTNPQLKFAINLLLQRVAADIELEHQQDLASAIDRKSDLSREQTEEILKM